MQKLHGHNTFFGWLNTFKILPTNVYLGRIGARPLCPPIISNPTTAQVLRNWNFADTGAFICFYALGLFVGRRIVTQMHPAVYIQAKRHAFFMTSNMMLGLAFFVGMLNSGNRLNGFTPNGLEWDLPQVPRVKKFDYTSDFIKRNPIIRWFVPFDL